MCGSDSDQGGSHPIRPGTGSKGLSSRQDQDGTADRSKPEVTRLAPERRTSIQSDSKYYPLLKALEAVEGDSLEMSFRQLEALMGQPLPESARNSRAFWSNRSSGHQAQAWLQNDLVVDSVDLEEEIIRWRRVGRGYHIRTGSEGIQWDGEAVRALREHMDLSQEELAEIMGVRQQTISEWETGAYDPSRSSAKHLGLVAERAEFPYQANPDQEEGIDNVSGSG